MIVVAGEALMDLIVSPSGSLTAVPGGGPYNAARTLGRLGADCTFLGVLADDTFGDMLRAGLAKEGVRLGCPTPASVPSSLAVAQLRHSGAATYKFYLDGTSVPMLSAREAWNGLPEDFKALHVGTLGLVVEPTGSVLESLVDEFAADHIVMLDPNCRPAAVNDAARFRARIEHLLTMSDLIKVSDEDVEFLYPSGGFLAAVEEPLSRGAILLHTAGAGPITVHTAAGKSTVRPPRGEVVDTVGAGDIFGATALWALIEAGWTKGTTLPREQIDDAVRTASAASFLACQRAGAEPPQLGELRRFLARPLPVR